MHPESNQESATLALILDTAEALLRRHGVDKLNVVDVAKALGMSHSNVYRHVPSKAALRAAVVARWLERVSSACAHVAGEPLPARDRLRQWILTLAALKRRKVQDDPEMLKAAGQIVAESPQVKTEHIERLIGQIATILRDGLVDGSLPRAHQPERMARNVLLSTFAFHHPDLVAEHGGDDEQLESMIALLVAGLGG